MSALMPKILPRKYWIPVNPPTEATQAPDSGAAQIAAQKAAEDQRRVGVIAKGGQSTILTGGLGDTTQVPTKRRTLLGEA